MAQASIPTRHGAILSFEHVFYIVAFVLSSDDGSCGCDKRLISKQRLLDIDSLQQHNMDGMAIRFEANMLLRYNQDWQALARLHYITNHQATLET
ncbi:predicted protein [Lichtheimia corymbifera JMRC:FSU:9682]|uniref:Uncharacterized protein n=1 Tax=Lichtheimia corymbifera JMRC:FSU:9682 TaxID=1263082 RepID=A0A068RH37_9FUNG|nr:predicted protein [Lichtheimia corymbifera JMRC:FSU:9682]